MPLTAQTEPPAACENCDRPAPGLGRLVVRTASGQHLYLSVCRWCHQHLARQERAKARP